MKMAIHVNIHRRSMAPFLHYHSVNSENNKIPHHPPFNRRWSPLVAKAIPDADPIRDRPCIAAVLLSFDPLPSVVSRFSGFYNRLAIHTSIIIIRHTPSLVLRRIGSINLRTLISEALESQSFGCRTTGDRFTKLIQPIGNRGVIQLPSGFSRHINL